MLDRRDRARDSPRHKGFTAARTFVVEQNAIARVQTIALAIIHRRPVSEHFCDAVRTARPKWRSFRLRYGLDFAEHFAARSLVEARSQPHFANCFENSDRSDASHVRGIFRDIETYPHVALRTEMINFHRV